MRLFIGLIVAGILSVGTVHAQTVPATPVNNKTTAPAKKTTAPAKATPDKKTPPPPPPHPVHVGPVNGPIKRDGTVNTTYKARKEVRQNKALPPPRVTPNKAVPAQQNSNSK